MTVNGGGYVYFLTNPSMPGLVKIGRTMRDPSKRVAELTSASGVPSPFRLEGYVRSADPVRTEAEIHRRLGAERVNRRREFFRVEPAKAVDVARRVAKEEKSRFRQPTGSLSMVATAIHFSALLAYYNVVLLSAGLDFRTVWKPLAANLAMGVFLPNRVRRKVFRSFALHPLMTHAAFVATCVGFYLFAGGMRIAATL